MAGYNNRYIRLAFAWISVKCNCILYNYLVLTMYIVYMQELAVKQHAWRLGSMGFEHLYWRICWKFEHTPAHHWHFSRLDMKCFGVSWPVNQYRNCSKQISVTTQLLLYLNKFFYDLTTKWILYLVKNVLLSYVIHCSRHSISCSGLSLLVIWLCNFR